MMQNPCVKEVLKYNIIKRAQTLLQLSDWLQIGLFDHDLLYVDTQLMHMPISVDKSCLYGLKVFRVVSLWDMVKFFYLL